jgi:hypothetical protein
VTSVYQGYAAAFNSRLALGTRLPALLSELHFVVAVVSPLEYIRVQPVKTLRKLGIQAVHRTD